MFFYNWREMAAWVAIFVVALAIIIIGMQSGGEGTTLRLAVGPKESFQHQAGEALKSMIERRTPYQVVLVEGEDSQAVQHLLLDRKADLALLAPAALGGSQQWVGLAPVASLYAHVLVSAKSSVASLYEVKADEISLGNADSDARALGLSILQGLDLAPKQEMSLGGDLAPTIGDVNVVTDHFSASQWKDLLAPSRYRLLPLREVSALHVKDPRWVLATIPAYVHSFSSGQLPVNDINTAATPLVLATLPDASSVVVAEIASVMASAEGKALQARYHQLATESAWQLLPKHAAVGGDAVPVRELLREELAWWVQHKTLVLLILLGLALVIMQTRNLGKSRSLALKNRVAEDIESMLAQLLSIEQRARTDNDLRALYQLLDEVNQLKLRGSKQMLGTPLIHDPLLMCFHQQCNHVMSVLERRLQGKPNLAAVA